tara:strand:+ start:281 stop:871 length:591 start_codon:yes stop_codon:yes gene_type:complete
MPMVTILIGGYIRLPNVNIITHHFYGKLMYSFGKLSLNVCNIKNYNVKDNDIVIFCFGEIDCRNHVHKHISQTTNYKSVIDLLTINYFNAINDNINQYTKLHVCVYNIIPPTKKFYCDPSHPYPFLGTDEERKLYYTYMNQKLKELCAENNFLFFDIYNDSCDKDGFLKKEFSDGNVHLRNTSHSSLLLKKILNIN